MPTAFCAEWSNGDGPIIGMYCEYDAIPGNCQAASTRREPRAGLGFQAGGHTDPHSGLGIGALGGLLATKAAMEKHGIKGGLRFTGIAFNWSPTEPTAESVAKSDAMISIGISNIIVDNCTFNSTPNTEEPNVPRSCIYSGGQGYSKIYIHDNVARDYDHFITVLRSHVR